MAYLLATMYKTLFLLCASFYLVLAKHDIYDGHSLFEVNVKDVNQAKLVNSLENYIGVDVWSHALPGKPGQILVPRNQRQEFLDALNTAGVDYKIEVENIKEKLELEDQLLAASARKSNRSSAGLSFDTIHRYEVIDAYLVELANRYPNTVTVVSGGRSFEGRDIKYLKISSTNFQDELKPIVMMESLLHCREWAGLPVTLYAIEKLVIDVTEQDLIRDIDWIIIPVANPDGYEHTHTNARFWRKNRATGFFPGNLCMGVDLNRNFDSLWGTASSNNACSETFHGSAPFSEPETAVIRDIILEHRERIELFLDIHSFGSMLLYGFGNGVLPPNGLSVHVNGVLMVENIDRVKWASNPNYIVGNVALILYDASGSAQDYSQEVTGTHSYTFELPAYRNQQNSLNGFLIEPDFIEQVGFETWEGIKAGARYALNTFRIRMGLD